MCHVKFFCLVIVFLLLFIFLFLVLSLFFLLCSVFSFLLFVSFCFVFYSVFFMKLVIFCFSFYRLDAGMRDGRPERGGRGGHHDVHHRNGPAVGQGHVRAVQRQGVVFRKKTDGSFYLVPRDREGACPGVIFPGKTDEPFDLIRNDTGVFFSGKKRTDLLSAPKGSRGRLCSSGVMVGYKYACVTAIVCSLVCETLAEL